MASLPDADDRGKSDPKIALFLRTSEVRWLICAIGVLPRKIRKPLERTLSQQIAEHREVCEVH